VGLLLTFDIPQTALVATLDTYDFLFNILSVLTSVTSLFQIEDKTENIGGGGRNNP
jgi:hypothetical protein